jgi:hypothetical protein
MLNSLLRSGSHVGSTEVERHQLPAFRVQPVKALRFINFFQGNGSTVLIKLHVHKDVVKTLNKNLKL